VRVLTDYFWGGRVHICFAHNPHTLSLSLFSPSLSLSHIRSMTAFIADRCADEVQLSTYAFVIIYVIVYVSLSLSACLSLSFSFPHTHSLSLSSSLSLI